MIFREQLRACFRNADINVDALYRAHRDALRLVEMSNTFGTTRRIDFVDDCALGDGLVRAGRLTDVAIDAQFVDQQRLRPTRKRPEARMQSGAFIENGNNNPDFIRATDTVVPTGSLRFNEHEIGRGRRNSIAHALFVGCSANEQHTHVLE